MTAALEQARSFMRARSTGVPLRPREGEVAVLADASPYRRGFTVLTEVALSSVIAELEDALAKIRRLEHELAVLKGLGRPFAPGLPAPYPFPEGAQVNIKEAPVG